MARRQRNYNLSTRNARKSLVISDQPYWRSLQKNLSIGYRKGKNAAKWCSRIRLNGAYVVKVIGTVDDYAEADGKTILSYEQAVEAALTASKNPNPTIPTHSYTVNQAIEDYLEKLRIESKSVNHTLSTIDRYIRPKLGQFTVDRLSKAQIEQWKLDISTTEKNGEEAKRKRKATTNRILTVLKAILNYAYDNERCESKDAWTRVKPFKNVDAPKIRYLTEAECKRLINRSDAEFRPLIEAALLTGARYGELVSAKTEDFNSDTQRLTLFGKSQKYRTIPLSIEGVNFFSAHCAGKSPKTPIFTRNDGQMWGKSHQIRPMKHACEAAKINPPISFHILRHTYASLLIMKGTALREVSELLGHADMRITMRNYAHLSESHTEKVIRSKLPKFGVKVPNVTSIQ